MSYTTYIDKHGGLCSWDPRATAHRAHALRQNWSN